MALKAGRVGVNPDYVDKEGRPILSPATVESVIAEAINALTGRITVARRTGNPLLLDGAIGGNVQKLTVGISALQAGSGEPSAQNIRAISGLSTVNLNVDGKNILPVTLATLKSINNTGTWSGDTYTLNSVSFAVSTDDNGYVTGISVNGTASAATVMIIAQRAHFANIPDGNYIMNGCPKGGATDGTTYFLGYYSPGKTKYSFGDDAAVNVAFTDNVSTNVYISIANGYQATDLVFKPMFRLASVLNNTFEPYKGVTYAISLGATIYGGYYDAATGVLTVTHGYIASYDGEELPGEWISDRDVYAVGTTPTTGAQVVYKLAENTTSSLSPVTPLLYKGNNVILANTGTDLDLFYLGITDTPVSCTRSLNRSTRSIEQIELPEEDLKKEVKEEDPEPVEPVTTKKSTRKTTSK